jgi:hypothetical protein
MVPEFHVTTVLGPELIPICFILSNLKTGQVEKFVDSLYS